MGLLIVPLVLGVGVFLLNRAQRRSEQGIAKESRKQDLQLADRNREQDLEIAEKNRETDRQIARDRQHQTTLETYFDRMTELILENGLGKKKVKKGVQSIARTRTLAVLRSLDAEWVGAVFRFIDDAELKDAISLAKGNLRGVIWKGADLTDANLSGADLRWANLNDVTLDSANLSGTTLFEANLNMAFLSGANLSGANLSKADLDGADLTDAKDYTDEQLREAGSLKGATMPDGTEYEEWIKSHGEDGQVQSQEADEQPKVDEQSAE